MSPPSPEDRAGARRARVRTHKCPICGKPAAEESHLFCGRRCREVDLARWLKGQYAIPASEPPEDAAHDSQEGPGDADGEGSGEVHDGAAAPPGRPRGRAGQA